MNSYKVTGALLIFLIFIISDFNWDFASEFLLIPRPEAEITKCLSRRGRFSGSPENLILGWMGRKVKFGGGPILGPKSSLLVLYIGSCVGGRTVTKLRGRPLPEAGAQLYRAGGEPETIFSDIQ